jgi:ubiquinone biosynthesis protein UbiJ
MKKEMEKSKAIDDAFKEIKTATRVADVQEMVKKFLTRESTYSQLLAKVSEFERHMENLKRDNDALKERLNELNIDT